MRDQSSEEKETWIEQSASKKEESRGRAAPSTLAEPTVRPVVKKSAAPVE